MCDSPPVTPGKIPVRFFELGDLIATPGVLEAVPRREIDAALARHSGGDWGSLEEHDREANAASLASGGRLVSAYNAEDGTRFWIITEHDRSRTTVLLPMEY